MAGQVTRIAPSPSGLFHIGTARTAYHNWLAARASGGRFLLRIDDTNDALSDQRFVDVIYDAMSWLGLDHDGTFRQSSRLDRHRQVADDLVRSGKAVVTDGGAVALSAAHCDVPSSWVDSVLGKVHARDDDRRQALSTILLRRDGSPTYHLATVVDDHDFGVNHVIRGQDHVPNTLRQLAIYHSLGWGQAVPLYAHVGLIHKDGKKLSKRDGAASLLDHRDRGYDPDAMLNYLLRLGWGPTVDDRSASFLPQGQGLGAVPRRRQAALQQGQLRPGEAGLVRPEVQGHEESPVPVRRGCRRAQRQPRLEKHGTMGIWGVAPCGRAVTAFLPSGLARKLHRQGVAGANWDTFTVASSFTATTSRESARWPSRRPWARRSRPATRRRPRARRSRRRRRCAAR
jgi:glutamyl-tRNA synthetase